MKSNLTVGERGAEEDGRTELAAAKLKQSNNLPIFFCPLSGGGVQCPELWRPRESETEEKTRKGRLSIESRGKVQ